jgi:hypothetical protein
MESKKNTLAIIINGKIIETTVPESDCMLAFSLEKTFPSDLNLRTITNSPCSFLA